MTMRNCLRKIKTLLDYGKTGFYFGKDLRSQGLLASFLPRTKILTRNKRSKRVYDVTVRIQTLTRSFRLRSADIYIAHEMLRQNPYVSAIRDASPRCIVDLGAHIGLSALQFKASFPDAHIYCYEPDPENFQLLRHNLSNLPDVFFFQEAVGARSGEGTLYVQPGQPASSSLQCPSKAARIVEKKCAIKRLDDILNQTRIPVDLIKFDVEGAEEDVFKESEGIHDVQRMVGELKASPSDLQKFIALFPGHKPSIKWVTSKMAIVYFERMIRINDGQHDHA